MPPRQPLGTTHTAPAGTLPPDTQPPDLSEPPPEVRALTAAVQALGAEGHRDHANILAALRALEDALVVVTHPDADIRARMHYTIDLLESSPPTSQLHAEYVRTTLELAATAAGNSRPWHTRDFARYRGAIETFVQLVSQLDPERPLLEQHERVRAALQGAVKALHAAVGLPSPLDGERHDFGV